MCTIAYEKRNETRFYIIPLVNLVQIHIFFPTRVIKYPPRRVFHARSDLRYHTESSRATTRTLQYAILQPRRIAVKRNRYKGVDRVHRAKQQKFVVLPLRKRWTEWRMATANMGPGYSRSSSVVSIHKLCSSYNRVPIERRRYLYIRTHPHLIALLLTPGRRVRSSDSFFAALQSWARRRQS